MGKGKKVSYLLIKPKSIEGEPMYAMLKELVGAHHEDLDRTNARIALAWNLSWQPDLDGRVTLGKCKRASDLDRELASYYFVILLQAEFWQDGDVKDTQRRALMDHELCHAAIALDRNGDPARDERGRYVYRTRKHDIEEFQAVIERHGCYKRDLEDFAAALRRSKQGSLLDQAAAAVVDQAAGAVPADPKVVAAIERLRPKKGSHIESVTITAGGKSATLRAR